MGTRRGALRRLLLARIIYTSDLHGRLQLYKAAGEAVLRLEADAVVFGGDLCPGTPSASSIHLPQAQPEFLLRELSPMLQAWRRARPALRIFAIPGNDDCQTILPALAQLERAGLLENLHQRSARLGNYTLVGLAFVPPTPFAIKDFERRDHAGATPRLARVGPCVLGTSLGFEVLQDFETYLDSHPTIEEELNLLPIGEPQRTIGVIHCPPYRTRCDVLSSGQHIGSEALRRWIGRVQPLLTLHGHIHESPHISGAFCDRLGATTIVNPGADPAGRGPHLVFINLEDLSVLEHSVYGKFEITRER